MAESTISYKPGNNRLVSQSQEQHYCWICYSTKDDDKPASWVHPCNCCGSTKWVHQVCLQRWVDEKQNGNILHKVNCPQCNTEYVIQYPEMGSFLFFLNSVDNKIKKVYPFLATGIIFTGVYWVALTFGAITLMQVLDTDLNAMEETDPLLQLTELPAIPLLFKIFGRSSNCLRPSQYQSVSLHTLLISLPAIPVLLIMSKMISWEESFLAFLRTYMSKVPLFKYICPSFVIDCEKKEGRNNSDFAPVFDIGSAAEIFCSALVFPTIACVCGNLVFQTVSSKVKRTLFGGFTFILLKGFCKIYYKQQQYVQENKKIILNFVVQDDNSCNPKQPS